MATSPIVNPLGYQGVHSLNPPSIWFRPRDPTSNDWRNYAIGDQWQNTINKQFWILVSLANFQAVWENFTGPSSGAVSTLSDNSSTAILVPPNANGNIQVLGDGTILTSLGNVGANSITISLTGTVPVANGGTGATTLTGVLIGNGTSAVTGNVITQHDVLVGGAANAITSIAPSATSGVPLVSAGAAANPAFGTAVVAGGGTGLTTLTAYNVLLGNGTGNIAFAAPGATGTVLTSTGTGSNPTFQAPTGISRVNIQTIATTGVYTPTTSMKYCIVELVGSGGGGSGGFVSSSGGAGGGGGGGYARAVFSAAQITAASPITATIGAAGTGGANGAAGTDASTCSFGTLLTVTAVGTGAPGGALGGVGGIGALGGGVVGFATNGTPGGTYTTAYSGGSTIVITGQGGSSFFGGGARGVGGGAGTNATSYGGGGSGGINGSAGGNGMSGICVITEYI